jgi:methionyl-tRNA formyltransferase
VRIVLFHNWSSLGYAVAQALMQQGADELVLIGAAVEHPDIELVEQAAARRIPCGMVDAVDNEAFAGDVRGLAADIALVATFPMKLPVGVLGRLPRGAFNVHPSLLPAHRGPSPEFWALRDGDAETGVTIHELDERFDAGAIVTQTRIAIEAGETGRTLDDKLCGAAAALVLDFVARLRAGETLPRVTQDESRATRARMPRAEDLTVRWRDSARSIERLVRACDGGLLATATLGGERVGLVAVQLAEDDDRPPLGPGELRFDPEDRTLCCGTGDGALLLEEVEVGGVTLDAEDVASHLGLVRARDLN